MKLSDTTLFYFSATGGTKLVIDGMLQSFSPCKTVSLQKTAEIATVPTDQLAIFAAPVYGGRIGPIILDRFKHISGKGPAVIIAVYGNRAYEDALVEMQDYFTAKGFTVIAAAAFIAEHSVYPPLAAGRPDQQDLAKVTEFAQAIIEKIRNNNNEIPEISGNRPYKEFAVAPVIPVWNDTCTKCGMCATNCPQAAIPETNPSYTDPKLCMSCMACIKICPVQARQIPLEMQPRLESFLKPLTQIRREPEFFI